jgi:integrase
LKKVLANFADIMYEACKLQTTYLRRIPTDGELGSHGSGKRMYPWDPPELRINPHTFRHTFAAWHLRRGVGMAIVSAWLGHSTVKLTVICTGISCLKNTLRN